MVAEDGPVLVREVGALRLDEGEDLVALLGRRQPDARAQALLDGGVASHPAEDEHDRRQQAGAVEPVEHVGPARDPDAPAVAHGTPAAALRPALRRTPVAHPRARPVVAGDPDELGVDGSTLLDEPRRGVDVGRGEQVQHPPSDQHVLVERHRPALLDDRDRVTAHRLQPLAELLGVGHGRRQRDQRDRVGQVDDHLLPDRAAGAVGEVVHLVHHDVPQAGEGAGAGVQHVPQDLGRHHDDRRLPVDARVAGEQADPVDAVPGDQVVVLLVGESLDRRRVERLAPGLERQVDGELADHRLARAGGRRDEDALALLHDMTGPDLEGVQPELVQPRERVEHGVRGHTRTVSAPGAHSTVRGSGPKRSPSAYDTMPGAATVTDRTRWCSYCGWWMCVPLNSFG